MTSKLQIHLATLLRGRDSRRLPSHRATTVRREPDGTLSLAYYGHDLIRVGPDGRAVVSAHGERGPTIKSRLNDCLIFAGLSIIQRAGVWYWHRDGRDLRLPFHDGDVVGVRGKVEVQLAGELSTVT